MQAALTIFARRARIMGLDAKTSSKGIIETLRDQIAELESLEVTGIANFDTCEMLVDLHNLLDKIYAMLLGKARKTLQ
jgi:hypothetical protein